MKERETYLKIFNELLGLFVDEITSPRMSLPLISTMEFLISSGFMEVVNEADKQYMVTVMKATWSCICKTSDAGKKMAGAGLFASILRFEGVCKNSLSHLVVLICSPSFPRVRASVAELLHTSLLTFPENCITLEGVGDLEVALETCLDLLRETDWTTDVQSLKPVRSQLSLILGVKCPS